MFLNVFNDPPANTLWSTLHAKRIDYEFARNALLNFIEEKGLTDEVLLWLKENDKETNYLDLNNGN